MLPRTQRSRTARGNGKLFSRTKVPGFVPVRAEVDHASFIRIRMLIPPGGVLIELLKEVRQNLPLQNVFGVVILVRRSGAGSVFPTIIAESVLYPETPRGCTSLSDVSYVSQLIYVHGILTGRPEIEGYTSLSSAKSIPGHGTPDFTPFFAALANIARRELRWTLLA